MFQVFQRLREEAPEVRKKLVCVSGDCSLPALGLKAADVNLLSFKINVVLHSAATVKFNEKLKFAFDINVNGTKRVLSLCRNMQNLKVALKNSIATN